jgi:hypothetical protein
MVWPLQECKEVYRNDRPHSIECATAAYKVRQEYGGCVVDYRGLYRGI